MTKPLDEITALTSALSPEARDLVEGKLLEEARKLIAEFQSEAEARDDLTREALAEIEAGRLSDVASARKRSFEFLEKLNTPDSDV